VPRPALPGAGPTLEQLEVAPMNPDNIDDLD